LKAPLPIEGFFPPLRVFFFSSHGESPLFRALPFLIKAAVLLIGGDHLPHLFPRPHSPFLLLIASVVPTLPFFSNRATSTFFRPRGPFPLPFLLCRRFVFLFFCSFFRVTFLGRRTLRTNSLPSFRLSCGRCVTSLIFLFSYLWI